MTFHFAISWSQLVAKGERRERRCEVARLQKLKLEQFNQRDGSTSISLDKLSLWASGGTHSTGALWVRSGVIRHCGDGNGVGNKCGSLDLAMVLTGKGDDGFRLASA